MATLTAAELRKVRNTLERKVSSQNWDKPTANAAAQAVEDLLVSSATAISNAIDTATSPFTFTATQKKWIVALVLRAKYNRDIT
jgi:hypothetical protein